MSELMVKTQRVLLGISRSLLFRMSMIFLFAFLFTTMVKSCNRDNGIYILGEGQGVYLAGELLIFDGEANPDSLPVYLAQALEIRRTTYPETIGDSQLIILGAEYSGWWSKTYTLGHTIDGVKLGKFKPPYAIEISGILSDADTWKLFEQALAIQAFMADVNHPIADITI